MSGIVLNHSSLGGEPRWGASVQDVEKFMLELERGKASDCSDSLRRREIFSEKGVGFGPGCSDYPPGKGDEQGEDILRSKKHRDGLRLTMPGEEKPMEGKMSGEEKPMEVTWELV